MIRLFWKVFLGFWAATALIVVGTVFVIHEFQPEQGRHFGPPPHEKAPEIRRLMFFISRQAVNADRDELIRELNRLPQALRSHIFVVDDQGRELRNLALPEDAARVLERLSFERPQARLRDPAKPLYGRLIQLSDGTVVKLLVTRPEPNRSPFLQLFLVNFWPTLLLAILVSGSLCYLLARYLSRPMELLKNATHQLASGNFNFRVSPLMAGRRDEMHSLAQDFDLMTEQLKAATDAQKRLIQDVSHELRSPLTRLQVALTLAGQQTGAAQISTLNKAQKAANYLNDIIDNILAIPLHGTDNYPLPDVLDLKGLLVSLADDYQAALAKKQLTLLLSLPEDEALVRTRSSLLRGVFDNLLNNALRHSPPHSALSLQLAAEGDQWRISLTDQGPGVAPEHLEKIFAPFYRTDEARDRIKGGVGLGLSIAQRSVALHGGQIHAHNCEPHGLAVVVCLPRLAQL